MKKKVLFVINTLGRAGAETALIELLRHLDPKQYEISVFVLTGQGEMAEDLPDYVHLLNARYDSSPVLDDKGKRKLLLGTFRCLVKRGVGLRLSGYLLKNFIYMLKNRHFAVDKLMWRVWSDAAPVSRKTYDLAVAFLEGGATYYVADHVKAAKKAAFVHIDYGMAGYNRKLDEDCYLAFQQIFTVSDEVRSSFIKVYPELENKIQVFHNMINQEVIRKKALTGSGFTDAYQGFRILTVGRLTQQKALEVSIEAMKLLKERGREARWYVLGEGNQREKLKKRIKTLRLEEDFILLGAVDNPYPYFSQTDLYVHATRYEGKSIAVQEAQTLGCAIVVSNCNGNREQVTDGVDGRTCQLNPEAICNQIIWMMDHPQERERYAEEAAKKVFSGEGQLEMHLNGIMVGVEKVEENKEAVTRTEYSMRNTSVAMISMISAIIMGYLLRVVFTHTLSESYVGLNGLFTDIVSVLSLSEMGVGTAITYALYRPVAEEDIEKQKSLMRLFCNFYRLAVVLVAALGCALIPFMRLLIKDYQDVEHLILIYLLYLIGTICSYLLIYKKTLLDAQQKMYIGVFFQTLSWIIQDVLKMIVLVLWHDYVLFLVIGIVFTLLCNIVISRTADRHYPYLRDREVERLPKEEKRVIYANIRAMMMHKAGNVVVNNTDTLVLSACVGLLSVGCYSNYYLVLGSVQQVLRQVYQGITASVGNLGVTEDAKQVKQVFDVAVFIGQWLYGVAFICLLELLNPVIELSFGEQYLFSEDIVFVLCLNFYITGLRNAVLTFRDSMGLFWYDRYKAILEAGLNIVLSLILVRYMGTVGVFLGTSLSMGLTSFWIEPYILYKYGFKSSCGDYFLRQGKYCALMAIVWLVTDYVCGAAAVLAGNLFVEIFIRLILCVVISDALLLLIYCRTDNFKYVVNIAKGIIKKKFRR